MNNEQFLLLVSAGLFSIGLVGLAIRRNILVSLMCIELLLNAANLVFVTFSNVHGNIDGQIWVFFVMTVAAAESAVGLGLVIALFRTLRTVSSEDIQLLRE